MSDAGRYEKITIRCTSKEKEQIKKNAEKYKMGLSDYCRERCLRSNGRYYRNKDKEFLRLAVQLQNPLNGMSRTLEKLPLEDEVCNELISYMNALRKGMEGIWQNSLS